MCQKATFLVAVALLLSLTAGCSGPSAAPTNSPEPTETAAVSTPEPTPEVTPASAPMAAYQFGTPVPESEPVADDSFFSNTVFLGDSRTEGLELFGGLKQGTFYWARGMSVFRADDEEYRVFPVDGVDCTLMEALGKKNYDTVYIMIGVNELGYPADSYEQGLSELIDKVLASQPEAVVYLQIMPPLNDEICRENKLADYINNDNLKQFNEAIVRVAGEKKVALLNTAEVYTGEDGQLPAELANDGCHFVYDGYTLWADYLRSHVIDRDLYFSSREQ